MGGLRDGRAKASLSPAHSSRTRHRPFPLPFSAPRQLPEHGDAATVPCAQRQRSQPVRAETTPPSGGKGSRLRARATAGRKSAARAQRGRRHAEPFASAKGLELPILSTSYCYYSRETIGGVTTVQNTSHAVMSQRAEALDSPDDFPTPPWATRALIKYVIDEKDALAAMTCIEPACGAGHMSKVLDKYFREVRSSDAYSYGYGLVRNFLVHPYATNACDWVIRNPQFRLAEEFVLRALKVARVGVAIIARTVFLESVGRYEEIFSEYPPTKFAQFCERVPMIRGRLEKTATTATGYAWFVWEKGRSSTPRLMWIPPCRRDLERDGDYDRPTPSMRIT